MPSRIVAIHQPNFLPWLGYFDKIARADIFVALDTVQFPKTGGTWSNRVRIRVNGRPAWITMPVARSFHGLRSIAEMRMAGTAWRERLVQTLQAAYMRAPRFREVFPVIEDILTCRLDTVGAFNLTGVRRLADSLGLDTGRIVPASTLAASGRATDLLIALVQQVGGTAYLSGGGTRGYQEDEKFTAAGLQLVYQEFQHPVYPQGGTEAFVPGLSIVDALMNCGFEGTRGLLTTSCVAPPTTQARKPGDP
jgi:WbqC-like protein family